ncbi:cephalosporin-C deacetylase-like acetyl esterase [Actinomadura coerulea]|uniref:Cephalosporin-C deacetylase-like acetyl esterase n=1 Tax=Actinomadura coerulea TaxID=46159 RepID=A0A7X0G6T3_9ACTN|nr:hypothetical protein [Actinomadura coerulea]MBB6400523.1 cephalosporin-C deacetylase-like acetyl esterase [Actinomadura coerulea]GGQ07830.1 hypothetical protein GCM10010187_24900 [Actinomadura coerulea]
MGVHSRPDVTVPDGVLEDERMDVLARDVWEDFAPDRRLSPATVARVKRAGASLASGLAVAVALAVWPAVKSQVLAGTVDYPTLFESVRVAGMAAAGAYLTSRLRRK